MTSLETPSVSVVLVNFKGADQTIEAVQGLANLDWPADKLEIVVVDNDSRDGSVESIRAALPHVRLIESAANTGFAGGCNAGVRQAQGEIVAFLNSDARPDAAWLRNGVATLISDEGIGAVASQVRDWDGELVDYIDSALTWFGKGYKPFVGEPVRGLGKEPKDVLFGTGSAMMVRRDVFDLLGGFDEDFFMFYEDVDFGWRLNLLGWRFRYEPSSIAYHRHHGTVAKFGSFKERYLLERNALFCIYKNLEQSRLDEALPAALTLAIRRAVSEAGLDSQSYDFRSGADDLSADQVVPRETLATVFAIDQFVEHLPALMRKRRAVQASRRKADADVWALFGRVDAIAGDATYREGHENIAQAFDVTDAPQKRKVLIITGDPIGAKMAGPAIRAWHMAEALTELNDVVLMTMSRLEDIDAPFRLTRVRAGDNRSFEPWSKWADVIVFQGHALSVFPALGESNAVVVADIYDPMHLEQLEQAKALPVQTWEKQVADATSVLNDQMERADFLLCASERQRQFYLGQLAALGRLNPATYADDSSLRRLIDVAPFGLDSTPPVHDRDVLKGIQPGIGDDDKLLIWAGGLYNWFDPATLIRAVAIVASRKPSVKLFFQGTKHPHPGVPEMEVVREARALSQDLGVLDSHVFFNDSWVEYRDRQNYLLEADAGVSTHFVHLETTFSFRTRILDYLWAGLPMVVTEGDSFAELVATEGLGVVVPERDSQALADAIERVLFDEDFARQARENIARVRERFTWEATLAPLVDFMADPRRAADAQRSLVRRGGADSSPPRRSGRHYGVRHDLGLVAHHLRHGGLRVVARKVLTRLRAR